jgi:hypothetical protein
MSPKECVHHATRKYSEWKARELIVIQRRLCLTSISTRS